MSTELLNTEIVQPSALEVMQRAEVDVQITTAKRYPRQLSQVKQSMMSFATLDQETAEACFYSLPRGGKTIQGPSVRLAEIAVSCFKNIRAGSRIIETVASGPTPHVVIQAVAHDLENNVAVTIEKRRRIVKKKSKDTIDEDDINLAANAGSAVAFRDAVFKVVPMALIKPVFEAAKKVAIGDAKTLADRRAKMVDAFAKMGVQKERILALLEKKAVEDIDLTDLESLIGLFTAIKDGQTSIDETFPPLESKPQFGSKGAAEKKPEAPTFGTAGTEATSHPTAPPSTSPSGATVAAPAANSDEAAEAAAGLAPKQDPLAPSAFDKNTPQGKLAEFLESAGVTFSKFRAWAGETERLADADSFASWDQLPGAFCTALAKDAKSMNKCLIRSKS